MFVQISPILTRIFRNFSKQASTTAVDRGGARLVVASEVKHIENKIMLGRNRAGGVE